ncbi:Putative MetA-pathway of phenol degradation [Pseudomonas oryzae]|uniref:Putative MetA-pathway of phenol degradation n=1 Tax=Pseudomonas oryzae TaxID=1392877 RepID=A0A1H1LNJ2_9PSED|nr:Putative MetA-pathway of phenol degradation [Pseudomonas oryzae]
MPRYGAGLRARLAPGRRAFWRALAGLCGGLACSLPAVALDLDAGEYVPAPAGTTLGLLYLQQAERDHLYRDGHRLAGSPGLDSQIGILRVAHYADLGGYRIAPQIILPFGRVDGRHDAHLLGDSSGVADPSLAMPVWLLNQPEQQRFFAISPNLSIPVGSYDNERRLNLGENRWKLNLQAAYVTAIGARLALDLAADVTFYGRNDSYGPLQWSHRQKPSYQYQGFLRYPLSHTLDLRGGLSWQSGGENCVEDSWQNDSQRTGKWSAGFAWFFLADTQLVATVGRDLVVDNGFFEERRLNIRLLHVF